MLVASHPREVGGCPVLDRSPSDLVSPPGSVSEPIPSQISPLLRTDYVSRPPSGMAPMDQHLPRDYSLLLGESTDFPFLPAPLTPRPIGEKMVSRLAIVAASLSMPDLSREGPLMFIRTLRGRGPLHGSTLDSSSEFNRAYSIHLHDPWLLEYVGAPESAQLLSRSPEYWLQHMGREKTLLAVLQLQHDAGLILSNLQVLQQFVTSLNRMSSEVMRVAFDRKWCRLWHRFTVFVGWHNA